MKVTKENFREIDNSWIVVGILYGMPVILTSLKHELEGNSNSKYEFRILGNGFQRGNAYGFGLNLTDSIVEFLDNGKFVAYPESEWKKALSWLVRNG